MLGSRMEGTLSQVSSRLVALPTSTQSSFLGSGFVRTAVRFQPPDSTRDPEVTSFPHGPLLHRHKSQGPNSKARGVGDNREDQKNLWRQGNHQALGKEAANVAGHGNQP